MSSRILFFRIAVALIWVAFCISAYWEELAKALVIGIGFGIAILRGVVDRDEDFSRKAYAIFFGSIGAILIGVILWFQLYDKPVLTAGLLGLFVTTLIVRRWLVDADADPAEKTAERD